LNLLRGGSWEELQEQGDVIRQAGVRDFGRGTLQEEGAEELGNMEAINTRCLAPMVISVPPCGWVEGAEGIAEAIPADGL